MSNRIFPGTSAFFANRTKPNDNHNWLVNNARPILTITHTAPDGIKTYTDLFLNKDACDVKVTKTKVTLSFDTTVSKPLFRFLEVTSGRTQA